MQELIISLGDLAFTSEVLAAIVGILLGVLGGTLVNTDQRKRNVALATFHARNIVRDIAKATPGEDGWDKAEALLKAADEYMVANGWSPLKDKEKALVEVTNKSIAGQEKVIQARPQTPPATKE